MNVRNEFPQPIVVEIERFRDGEPHTIRLEIAPPDQGRFVLCQIGCACDMEAGTEYEEQDAAFNREMEAYAQLLALSPNMLAVIKSIVACPLITGDAAHWRDWHRAKGIPNPLDAAHQVLSEIKDGGK